MFGGNNAIEPGNIFLLTPFILFKTFNVCDTSNGVLQISTPPGNVTFGFPFLGRQWCSPVLISSLQIPLPEYPT